MAAIDLGTTNIIGQSLHQKIWYYDGSVTYTEPTTQYAYSTINMEMIVAIGLSGTSSSVVTAYAGMSMDMAVNGESFPTASPVAALAVDKPITGALVSFAIPSATLGIEFTILPDTIDSYSIVYGTIDKHIPLDTTVNVVVTSNGTLLSSDALYGNISAISTSDNNPLSSTKLLSSNISVISSVEDSQLDGDKALGSDINVTSSVSASLQASNLLYGTSDAQVVSLGTAKAIKILKSNITATVSSAADLSYEKILDADEIIASSLVEDVPMTFAIMLTADPIHVTSTTNAIAKVSVSVEAYDSPFDPDATATVSASMAVAYPLSTTITTNSVVYGVCGALRPLVGEINVIVTTNADLINKDLTGTGTSSTTGVGEIAVDLSLSGTISTVSSSFASLDKQYEIELFGSTISRSTVAPRLAVSRMIGGSTSNTAVLNNVSLQADKLFGGEIDVLSTIDSTFSNKDLVGQSIAITSVTNASELILQPSLRGTINITSSLSADLRDHSNVVMSPRIIRATSVVSNSSLGRDYSIGGEIVGGSVINASPLNKSFELSSIVPTTSTINLIDLNISHSIALESNVVVTSQVTNSPITKLANLHAATTATTSLSGEIYNTILMGGNIPTTVTTRGFVLINANYDEWNSIGPVLTVRPESRTVIIK